VTIPIVALFLAYLTLSRSTLASALLAVAAVAFGYTIMWRSGRGWFRWTAVPLLCWTLALVGTR
jgi:lipopolysaccharide export LptBFGC system permease protein LptF